MSLQYARLLDTAAAGLALAIVCLWLAAALEWGRRHPHPALYTLGRPLLRPSAPLIAGITGVVLAPGAFTFLWLSDPQAYSPAWTVAQCASALAFGINPLVQAISSWRIAEEGLLYPFGTVRWERLQAWYWVDAPDRPGVKVLVVKLPRFVQFRWRIIPGHEELITRLLCDHLGDLPVGTT
jgi:hypothetical protein